MITLIVSENSSFTNSVLAELKELSKSIVIRKSIIQLFKDFYLKLHPGQKVSINQIEHLAGDLSDINSSNIKEYLEYQDVLLKNTIKNNNISNYCENVLNSFFVSKSLSKDYFRKNNLYSILSIVDIPNKDFIDGLVTFLNKVFRPSYRPSDTECKNVINSLYRICDNDIRQSNNDSSLIDTNRVNHVKSVTIDYLRSSSGLPSANQDAINTIIKKVLIKNSSIKEKESIIHESLKDESMYDLVFDCSISTKENISNIAKKILTELIKSSNCTCNRSEMGRLYIKPKTLKETFGVDINDSQPEPGTDEIAPDAPTPSIINDNGLIDLLTTGEVIRETSQRRVRRISRASMYQEAIPRDGRMIFLRH